MDAVRCCFGSPVVSTEPTGRRGPHFAGGGELPVGVGRLCDMQLPERPEFLATRFDSRAAVALAVAGVFLGLAGRHRHALLVGGRDRLVRRLRAGRTGRPTRSAAVRSEAAHGVQARGSSWS